MKQDLKGIKVSGALTLAYEPIWAIGTGRYDEPQDAAAMATFIKKSLKCPILYGGSVTSKNIADYVQYKGIDGALVGGASLKAEEFKKIIKKVVNER
jgi:triosephosphate isomerase